MDKIINNFIKAIFGGGGCSSVEIEVVIPIYNSARAIFQKNQESISQAIAF